MRTACATGARVERLKAAGVHAAGFRKASQRFRRKARLLRSGKRNDPCPVEAWTWICLAAGRYVGMSGDSLQRIRAGECAQECVASLVLRILVWDVVGTLDLDTDRKIVAPRAPAPLGHAGMPRASQAGHELHYAAVAANEEMRRHPERTQRFEERVMLVVQTIVEQLLDPRAAELSRRKADSVDDHELDGAVRWPVVAVGRAGASDGARPALAVQRKPLPHVAVVRASAAVIDQALGSSSSFKPRRAMR